MSRCRNELIAQGNVPVPRSCQICGLFGSCSVIKQDEPKPVTLSDISLLRQEVKDLDSTLTVNAKQMEQLKSAITSHSSLAIEFVESQALLFELIELVGMEFEWPTCVEDCPKNSILIQHLIDHFRSVATHA